MTPAHIKFRQTVLLGIAALLAMGVLGACASSSAGTKQERLDAKIKARQGEPVDKICFVRNIDGWQELGSKSLLLKKSVSKWYKLDLAGTCRPQWAFDAIGFRTHPTGSFCLSKGDHIETFDPSFRGTCVITDIYKWDPKAEIPENPGNK